MIEAEVVTVGWKEWELIFCVGEWQTVCKEKQSVKGLERDDK